MADSWLIDGNCEVCRRKNYCKKECKLHRANWKRSLYNAVLSATGIDKILDTMSTPNFDAHEHMESVARYNKMLED